MNYSNKRVAITGHTGFLGSHLYKELKRHAAGVSVINGDIRKLETFSGLDHSYDYLFHFAAPSSQVLFNRNASYGADVTINGFLNAARACAANNIKLIYPSTGLLSQDQSNAYARCKMICEDIQRVHNIDAIAMRIFATYGPGEGHKRDYASVPYLFARDAIKNGEVVVFGDGNQKRDFIYVDDVVQTIIRAAEDFNGPRLDIGSGEPRSFNDILEILESWLDYKFNIKYVEKPVDYVETTCADVSGMNKIHPISNSLEYGIERIIAEIEGTIA